MAKKGYKERDLGWKEFKSNDRRIRARVGTDAIEVGFSAGNESLVKAVAAELGIGAPARPFISTTLDNGRKIYTTMLVDSMRAALVGGSGRDRLGRFKTPTVNVDTLLSEIGEEIRRDMQAYIRGWFDPENADSTVARKGFDDPLVETGAMQQDIEITVNF